MTDKRKFDYEVLDYRESDDNFYVDYLVTELKTGERTYVCSLIPRSDISYQNGNKLKNEFSNILSKNNGVELELPKTSSLKKITYKYFRELCNSESDMLFVKDEDVMYDLFICKNNMYEFEKDIEKFDLHDYFCWENKCLVVYGGLQCCFNDDIYLKEKEYER